MTFRAVRFDRLAASSGDDVEYPDGGAAPDSSGVFVWREGFAR